MTALIMTDAHSKESQKETRKKGTISKVFGKVKSSFTKQKVLSESEINELNKVLDPVLDWATDFSKDTSVSKSLFNLVKAVYKIS